MNDLANTASKPPSRATIWSGRVLTALLAALFVMSGVMKLMGGPEVTDGMAKVGLPEPMLQPLAVLEMLCALVYLIPQTTVLGAVLLTGYLGGAICTHWRVGDYFILHIVLGILVWLGVFLREPRLRSLLPLRR